MRFCTKALTVAYVVTAKVNCCCGGGEDIAVQVCAVVEVVDDQIQFTVIVKIGHRRSVASAFEVEAPAFAGFHHPITCSAVGAITYETRRHLTVNAFVGLRYAFSAREELNVI